MARDKPSVWEGSGAKVLLTLLKWGLGWSHCNTFNSVQLPYGYSCWSGGWRNYPCLSLPPLHLKWPVILINALLELFTLACVGTFEVKCHKCLLSGEKKFYCSPQARRRLCFLQVYPETHQHRHHLCLIHLITIAAIYFLNYTNGFQISSTDHKTTCVMSTVFLGQNPGVSAHNERPNKVLIELQRGGRGEINSLL